MILMPLITRQHLTEGKLALWKRDLTRSQTWSLWGFVEELNRAPEDHVAASNILQVEQEPVSDSGSWGTDFEDDEEDDDTLIKKTNLLRKNNNPRQSTEFRNSLMMFQRNEKLAKKNINYAHTNKTNPRPESIYMNCESEHDAADQENAYMNLEQEDEVKVQSVSQLHKKFEATLAGQLKEQLKLRYPSENKLMIKKPDMPDRSTKPKLKSFLHTTTNLVSESKEVKKPAAPPPRPEKCPRVFERSDELPKPPVMLRNFDLVANLPTKTDESEDEYEAFDEQIIEQNRIKIGSNQSLVQKSAESVYKPPSTTSQENQEDYEIYECITESPDDNTYYIQPIPISNANDPPPPPVISSTESTPTLTCVTNPSRSQNKSERSPDKKSATLPHSGSNTSLSAEMRATRPLPPPPFGQSYMESTWFHNVTRDQAISLIKDRAHNGYFLLRPSTSDLNNPLVLVLWFRDRVYNVPVRKRADSRFALGSLKADEQTFTNVEDIIKFYSKEELVLYSGGVQMGRTRLIDTPAKSITAHK